MPGVAKNASAKMVRRAAARSASSPSWRSAKGAWRFEVTTHRAEDYEPSSRKPEVAFSTALEADLARRDFTINSMALSLPELELVDPFNGRADLAARRLRTPLAPELSFTDDPLRMLRAARVAPYS